MEAYYLFIPYFYGFNSRAKSKTHKLSFVFVVIIPILLNVYLMTSGKFDFIVFLLAFTTMYMIYEIGYIYNDVFTVKKEINPTQWLDEKYILFIEEKYPLIIAFRVLYIIICLIGISYRKTNNFRIFILMMGILYLAFALHNYYRGRINIFTDGCLQIGKYCSILLLFIDSTKLYAYLIYIFLEIALVRTIEFGIGKKYIFLFLQSKNVDLLRVFYYSTLTIFSMFFYLVFKMNFNLIIGTIYMLSFRLLCLILGKNEIIRDNRRTNGKVNKL